MNWYLDVLRKYAVFEGRARRREFWVFALFNVLITLVLAFIEGLLGIAANTETSIVASIYLLAVLVPSLAVGVRRLHDTGRNGWWLLLGILPVISLVLLVFQLMDSQPGTNEYGPNPKGVGNV